MYDSVEILRDMSLAFPTLKVYDADLKEIDLFDENANSIIFPRYTLTSETSHELSINTFWQVFLINEVSVPKWFNEKYHVLEIFRKEITCFISDGIVRIWRNNKADIYTHEEIVTIFEAFMEA